MKVEVTVNVTVEAGDDWSERVFYALQNVGSEIYRFPQYIRQTGDGNNYTFEYQVKGTEV